MLGCQQDEVRAQTGAVVTVELAPEVLRHTEQLLASYENVRARLANDDVTGLGDDLQKLETAATQAASAATSAAAAQAALRSIAGAAKTLRDVNKSNADEVRRTFGELSRHLVALLVLAPRLQSGRFVFQCPMAQGYQKWVQTKSQVNNPYMGTRMLTCGSASDWS